MNRTLQTGRIAICMAALIITAAASAADDELVIEMDEGSTSDELRIDDGSGGDALTIDAGPEIDFGDDELTIGEDAEIDLGGEAMEAPQMTASESDEDRKLRFQLDRARLEYAAQTDSDSEADFTGYGHLAASLNWQPTARWELQVAGRIDAHDQDGSNSFTEIDGDYGDSFVRYRGDNMKLTLGSQTVIWGRLDELPLSDKVSTADFTRFVLDDLEDRRRSTPMLRAETFFAGGKLDMVWLFDFRAAELPNQDSIWHPINRQSGRILGIDPADIPPAAVQGAVVIEDEPEGDGGFGVRYTRTHSFADIGLTLARTRQSTPYFRSAGAGRFEAEYPRSWAYGADAAIDAAGATWRVEVVYNSDTPVTRNNGSYDTVSSVSWGGGIEMHPGDGDTRINLQLIGMNLVDAPGVLDRSDIYSLNGEIEVPFDFERWRASLDFYAGLGESDLYLNPELTFLGWEPHEIYVAAHFFDGSERSIGGFHKDHSSINLGWRAQF